MYGPVAVLFWAIGLVALLGRLRIAGVGGRIVTFLGMLFELLGIRILYGESPPVGIDLTPFLQVCQGGSPPNYCVIPMTQVIQGAPVTEASLLFIVILFLDGFGSIGP